METFKKYFNITLLESTSDDLDMAWITDRSKPTAFKLYAKDFQSIEKKKEIQYIFRNNWFPNFDMKNTLDDINSSPGFINAFNKTVSTLKSADQANTKLLKNYPVKGLGPGEILIYFLINTAYLGGGSSAGTDIVLDKDDQAPLFHDYDKVIIDSNGGNEYELKAVTVAGDGKSVYQFKVGGTFSLDEIRTDSKLMKFAIGHKGSSKEIGERDGMNQENINALVNFNGPIDIQELSQNSIFKKNANSFIREYCIVNKKNEEITFNGKLGWEKLNNKFAKLTYDNYFSNHDVIFMKNTTKSAGEIVYVGKVNIKDISIHAITSGTVKPRIAIK